MKSYKLKEKITVAGVETSEIEFRDPTTRDVRALGMPYKIGVDGTVQMNMDVCAKYIAQLSNLTDGDVDKLPVEEFTELSMEIIAFLGGQTARTPSIG